MGYFYIDQKLNIISENCFYPIGRNQKMSTPYGIFSDEKTRDTTWKKVIPTLNANLNNMSPELIPEISAWAFPGSNSGGLCFSIGLSFSGEEVKEKIILAIHINSNGELKLECEIHNDADQQDIDIENIDDFFSFDYTKKNKVWTDFKCLLEILFLQRRSHS